MDDHLWNLYTKGIISAEEMVDKGKDPGALRDRVHQAGKTIGRPELDEDDVG